MKSANRSHLENALSGNTPLWRWLCGVALAVVVTGCGRSDPESAGMPGTEEYPERSFSSWVWEDEDGRLAYKTTETGDRLPDFSHSGYMGGGVPLPLIEAAIELEPEEGDDAPRIQAAIDELAEKPLDENGFRGAILLKAGEWEIASPLRIGHGGIVLRGEGQEMDGTVLRVRGFEEDRSRVLTIAGSGSWQAVEETRQPVLTDYLSLGERRIPVENPSLYSVGDTVVVSVLRNDEWVAALGMDRIPQRARGGPVRQWPSTGYTMNYDRVIESVGEDHVVIDASLGETVRGEYGGAEIYRYEFPGRISQVGVENLLAVAEFKGEPEEQREDHAWLFIALSQVKNAWVRDITTRHFVHGAVNSSATVKWITVQDSRCLDPVGEIRGNRRYGFYIGGQLMLVQRCYANEDRHAFAFSARTPGPNAFVDCFAENSHADSGPHHRWATAGLMDNVRVPNHSIRVQNRLHFGSGHGWAGAYFVVWNSQAAHFMIHNPPIATNWAIGVIGERHAPTFADPATYRNFTDPDHIAEHGVEQPPEWGFDELGYSGWDSHNQMVEPVSLYLRQLEDRLGPEAVDNIQDHPYSFFAR